MGLRPSFSARNGSFTLTAGATRTLLQLLAAANSPIVIASFSLSVDSTSGSPVRWQIARQTTAGTSSTITPATHGPFGYANLAAGLAPLTTLSVVNATVEPTISDVVEDDYMPAGGELKVPFPLGREPVCFAGGRIALVVITPAGVTPNCSAQITWEE